MSENRIPLSVFVGINMIGYSLMIACFLSYMFFNDALRQVEQKAFFWTFSFLMILNFMAGLGLCLMRPWGRILSNVLLILSLLGSVIYLVILFNQFLGFRGGYNSYRNWEPLFTLGGILFLIISVLVGTILFLNNHRIVKELHQAEEYRKR